MDITAKSGIKLDIGCGANKQDDTWVGMDIQPLPGVDIVHDLLDIPYPLPDESVLVATCSHLLEHIPKTQVINEQGKLKTIHPFLMVMDEIWRILKVGGKLAIAVPHGASPGFLQDPTHASPYNETTWAYFDPEKYGGLLYSFYRPKPWRVAVNRSGAPEVFYDYSGNIEVILQKRGLNE